MKVYELHSPRDNFYGYDEPRSLKEIVALATSMGLDMVKCHIPEGLTPYEDQHPNKAVIFDARSEDVIMVEKG